MSFFLHIFLFGNIVAVKNISGINGGYAMWFSPVNCPRCCSSIIIIILIYNTILLCMRMLEIITVTTACVVPLSMSQQLTTPRRLNVSLVLLILFFSTKHPLTMLTMQYIFKGKIY